MRITIFTSSTWVTVAGFLLPLGAAPTPASWFIIAALSRNLEHGQGAVSIGKWTSASALHCTMHCELNINSSLFSWPISKCGRQSGYTKHFQKGSKMVTTFYMIVIMITDTRRSTMGYSQLTHSQCVTLPGMHHRGLWSLNYSDMCNWVAFANRFPLHSCKLPLVKFISQKVKTLFIHLYSNHSKTQFLQFMYFVLW